MKFYLTKAAQRAAEGQPTRENARPAKPSKPLKPVKSTEMTATVVLAPAEVTAPTVDSATAETATSAGMNSLVPTRKPTAGPKSTVARQSKGVIAIGGQPRVDLLPLEVRAERRAGQNVRRAWLGVVAVVVLVGIGGGAATLYAQNATASLTSAQGETATLSQQATKYSAVKTTEGQVDLVNAARAVGGSTDIDWGKYLAAVALTVPSGATLKDVTVDSASPVMAYAQASTPLQGQRVATLTLSETSTSLPSVPTWLENIAKLPAYEDAVAGSVVLKDGVYTATITMHVNKKAFTGAYAEGK